jgi:hypothetical protein
MSTSALSTSYVHRSNGGNNNCRWSLFGDDRQALITLEGPVCDGSERLFPTSNVSGGATVNSIELALAQRASFFAIHGGSAACSEIHHPNFTVVAPGLHAALGHEELRIAMAQQSLEAALNPLAVPVVVR